jgi:hypothetical protein
MRLISRRAGLFLQDKHRNPGNSKPFTKLKKEKSFLANFGIRQSATCAEEFLSQNSRC